MDSRCLQRNHQVTQNSSQMQVKQEVSRLLSQIHLQVEELVNKLHRDKLDRRLLCQLRLQARAKANREYLLVSTKHNLNRLNQVLNPVDKALVKANKSKLEPTKLNSLNRHTQDQLKKQRATSFSYHTKACLNSTRSATG